MPAKSGAQYRLMQMVAHGKTPNKAKARGLTPDVAQEFIDATPAKKRSAFSKKVSKKKHK